MARRAGLLTGVLSGRESREARRRAEELGLPHDRIILSAKVSADPSFRDVGVKMGAKVVTGSIQRDVASQTITFEATDGQVTYPVVYRGLAPDTFTDDVEVVVEGRLQPDGTFRATTLLAKCGSRYEAVPQADAATP